MVRVYREEWDVEVCKFRGGGGGKVTHPAGFLKLMTGRCFLRSHTTHVPLAWPLARICCTLWFQAKQPTSGRVAPGLPGKSCHHTRMRQAMT